MDKTLKRSKINEFLSKAQEEIVKYRKTGRFVYLQQASEKIYGAYTLLVELLSGKELYSHIEVGRTADKLERKYKDLDLLSDYAELLHVYFYEGKAYPERVVKVCVKAINLIKKLMLER